MRVLLWGSYDLGKPRVRLLRDGIREAGAELVECHVDLWSGIEDKSRLTGWGRWLRMGGRLLWAYAALSMRYLRAPAHDLVLVAYPGLPDMFVARLLAWIRRKPLAWDWFIGAYDTIVLDRRLLTRRHPIAWAIGAIEWMAVRLADVPFMDTKTHARRMEAMFGLRQGRVGHVWVGAEGLHFPPGPAAAHAPGRTLRVLFYGQFIPLHGVDTIIDAARLLPPGSVEWTLIGTGQEAARIRATLEASPVAGLRWIEWVPYAELSRHILDADVCLGIFGNSDKAASVIPNKVYQALCMERALVTRDSPAMRELLPTPAPGHELISPADPRALADAILRLQAATASGRPPPPGPCIGSAEVGRQFLWLVRSRLPRLGDMK